VMKARNAFVGTRHTLCEPRASVRTIDVDVVDDSRADMVYCRCETGNTTRIIPASSRPGCWATGWIWRGVLSRGFDPAGYASMRGWRNGRCQRSPCREKAVWCGAQS